jgi:hypothetical protein
LDFSGRSKDGLFLSMRCARSEWSKSLFGSVCGKRGAVSSKKARDTSSHATAEPLNRQAAEKCLSAACRGDSETYRSRA